MDATAENNLWFLLNLKLQLNGTKFAQLVGETV